MASTTQVQRGLVMVAIAGLSSIPLGLLVNPLQPDDPCPKTWANEVISTTIAGKAGGPCCYRENGKSYSSTYDENGNCQSTTALLCFVLTVPQSFTGVAVVPPPENRGSGREFTIVTPIAA